MTQRLGRAGVQWVVGGFSLSLSLFLHLSLSLSALLFRSSTTSAPHRASAIVKGYSSRCCRLCGHRRDELGIDRQVEFTQCALLFVARP